jgi:hypothetical protein
MPRPPITPEFAREMAAATSMMTQRTCRDFRAFVDQTAESYENLPDGTTLVTCQDGLQIRVWQDGNTEVLAREETSNGGLQAELS